MAESILVAKSKEPIFLLPKMANRHGLIAGATGTGKTVTLQTLAENFIERAKIVPPRSQVGAITADQRKAIIASSIVAGHYEETIDRESAYEILQARAGEIAQTAGAPPEAAGPPTPEGAKPSILAEALATATAAFEPRIGPRGGRYDSLVTSMVKSAMRAASSSIGRQIARGILGGGGRRR
jgi:DNA helicase HerA-like ATPase